MDGDGIQVVEAEDVDLAIRERSAGPLPAALPVPPRSRTRSPIRTR